MHIVTSQALINKYGPGTLDLLKRMSQDVTVLPSGDFGTVKAHCDSIQDEILIVGGPSIVSFGLVNNPASDPDGTVLTDAPYACTNDATFLIPNKVVCRLPDEDLNYVENFLEQTINFQMSYVNGKSSKLGWFNYVASVWKPISDWISANFKMGDQNVCPPTVAQTLNVTEMDNKKFAYVNLHGAQSCGQYFGQSGMSFPVALTPTSGMFNGCLVFAEACYGGYISNRSRFTSIPLMALYSGCLGFVCSTAVAYGPAQPPPDSADLLSYFFFKRIAAGEPFGQAFMHSKQDFAQQCIKVHGSIDPTNKKTLLEFQAYGLPIIKP